ncbi:MAG: hypothetical protein IJY31_04090 [Muribaculaceae bacterium]|nr:hypothetical protein [Muribaculaceae bacterium]
MKKMRLLSLAVAAVLCSGFVSCSDDDDEPQKSADNAANPETDEYGIAVSQEVDLGLSVNWASWNVGASSPEEYGGYYAWGETDEKYDYDESTYKWCNGRDDTLTKYCTDSDDGTVDNRTVLEPQDDVAHVKWGDGWRMPTEDELLELENNCTWTWITYNGVNGYKVTGRKLSKGNRNSIFLPAAGYHFCTSLSFAGDDGLYWSSTLNSNSSLIIDNDYAYALSFHSNYSNIGCDSRRYGRSVRPVKEK